MQQQNHLASYDYFARDKQYWNMSIPQLYPRKFFISDEHHLRFYFENQWNCCELKFFYKQRFSLRLILLIKYVNL